MLTLDQLRQDDHPTRVFDVLMDGYGRRERPWTKFYEPEVTAELGGLDMSDAHAFDAMVEAYRHEVFEALCERISEAEGTTFDAWGPVSLPTFAEYLDGLSPYEERCLLDHMHWRRLNAIAIETGGRFARETINYPEMTLIMHRASSDRQRFRFISSIIDHPPILNFSPEHITELREVAATYRRQFSVSLSLGSILRRPISSPLRTRRRSLNLLLIIDAMRATEHLDPATTDEEVLMHWTWEGKNEDDPVKQFQRMRSDLRRSKHKPDHDGLEAFIRELRFHLPK